MKKTLIPALLMALWMTVIAGCAMGPETRVSVDKFEAARQSLAKIDLSNDKVAAMTARQAAANPEETAKEEERTREAFSKMLEACKTALAHFESKADRLRTAKIAISTVGAIAGAVVVPGLTAAATTGNAVWIAAFGGVSGVANTAQQTMSDVGLDAKSVLVDRQKILDNWRTAVVKYYEPNSTYTDRMLALQRALAECTLYGITIPDAQIDAAK